MNDTAAQNAAYGGLMSAMGGMRNGNLAGVPPGDIGYAGMLGNDRYGTVFGDRIANDIAAQRGIAVPSVSLGDVFSGNASIPTFGPANAPDPDNPKHIFLRQWLVGWLVLRGARGLSVAH
jgi:hypothetical protein